MKRSSPLLMRARHRSPRRGSTLIIVLGVLSLLVLLAVALSFTSKLETISAKNFQDYIQARTASTTGVARAARSLHSSLPVGATGALDLSLDPEFLRHRAELHRLNLGTGTVHESVSETQPKGSRMLSPVTGNDVSDVAIIDSCGLVNINTASEDMIEAIFAEAAARARVSFDARALAERIVDRRLGNDGKPGLPRKQTGARKVTTTLPYPPDVQAAADTFGVQESNAVYSLLQPAGPLARSWDRERADRIARAEELFSIDENEGEYFVDVRRPAEGDDMRIADFAELMREFDIPPGVMVYATPFLTTFSVTEERRVIAGASVPLLDLNRASAQDIYAALRALYIETPKNDEMLRQFAVNLVDARDADRLPTRMRSSDNETEILGLERTPLLIEVYAQPRRITLETNDGQYVQIYNPWSEAFDLTGWSIEGAGASLPLSGTIPAGGFLIVTNDKNNENDPHHPPVTGEGSLYDIFGVTSGGPGRRIIENRALSLPTNIGKYEVRLVSRERDLVDRFPFAIERNEQWGVTSFKRTNPVVRDTVRGTATPFAFIYDDSSAAAELRTRLASYPPDAPFTRLTEVFGIFQGFARPDGSEELRWAFPAIGTPNSAGAHGGAAADPRRMDARMIDLFTIETEERRPSEEIAGNLSDRDGDGKVNPRRRPRLADFDSPLAPTPDAEEAVRNDWNQFFERPIGLRYGLINLNTAPAEVLRAIPGMTPVQVTYLLRERAIRLNDAQKRNGGDGLLYRTPSEILCDDTLWEQSGQDRLDAFEGLYSHTTLSSRSFLLVGRSRAEADSTAGKAIESVVHVLVATDRPAPDYVALSAIR